MQHTLWESQPSMTKVHCRELGSQRFCIILLCCLQPHYPLVKKENHGTIPCKELICAQAPSFASLQAQMDLACSLKCVHQTVCLSNPHPFPRLSRYLSPLALLLIEEASAPHCTGMVRATSRLQLPFQLYYIARSEASEQPHTFVEFNL